MNAFVPAPIQQGRWLPVDLDSARAYIARRLLGTPAGGPASIGDITLLPHQRDAVVRLRIALARFHGALLADDVGLGKTFVALAIAREYGHVHVVAPAGLLPMWRQATARCAARNVSVHSLHRCSRGGLDLPVPGPGDRELVVVDEAHALRTPTTRRYRTVSDAVAGRDVLLLSATPVHNRPRELRAQLALFMGAREDLLTPELLARLIVRRTSESVQPPWDEDVQPRSGVVEGGGLGAARDTSTPPDAHGGSHPPRRPRVREHPPFTVPHDPATLAGILALPAPLPAHDGAAAGALIRLGLLRAWCSSDAALEVALARRLLRGSALRDALHAGRHPTNDELRSWVVGDDSGMQLAFPELVTAAKVEPSSLLGVLSLHLDALSALRERHRLASPGDEARASHLRQLLHEHPGVGLVAFSGFSATVRALYRALSDIAGVGMLTGASARIASGRLSRRELLARFAPGAQGVPPPPPHGVVRLLLATDTLAEGVNLQDAGIVVHLDLPWTDALCRQRVGRVARLGSARPEVHVYAIHPPAAGERALRQLERLRTKAEHGARLVGATGGAGAPRSAPDAASALRRQLQSWTPASAPSAWSEAVAGPMVTIATAVHAAWDALVLVDTQDGPHLLAYRVMPDEGLEWSEALGDVYGCVRAVGAGGAACPHSRLPDPSRSARRLMAVERSVAAWASGRRSRDQAGDPPSGLSVAQRRALDRIRGVLASERALARGAVAAAADAAMAAVRAARGASAERELEAWIASAAELRPVAWIDAWRSWPALRAGARLRVRPDTETPHAGPILTTGSDEPHGCAIRAVVLLETLPAG